MFIFESRGILFFSILLLCCSYANARPSYAVRYNNISCTSCHFSPAGGGPKKLTGKLFASRWFQTSELMTQDTVSADFRTLLYEPEKTKESKGGVGIMSGSVAAHVPVDKNVYLVLEHNIAGFSAAPYRDTYALFQLSPPSKNSWLESILVGRFRPPFGLGTAEHRTYTRIQTGTQWFSFETGALLSGTPLDQLHLDLAIVSGKNSTGQTLNPGQGNQWGGVFNIRYMPSFFMLGASSKYNDTDDSFDNYAWSLYSVISIDRLTHSEWPFSINLEYSQAKGFNSILSRGLASNGNYVDSLKSAISKGALVRLDWLLNNKLTLVYKYDWLVPDKDYQSDIYQRQGIGLRWNIAAFTYLEFRSEMARATHPSEADKTGSLSQNANFAILEVSF